MLGMARKPTNELPTHYLQWHDKDGKPDGVWRVRLLNPRGHTLQDDKRYFHVIPDPNKHSGLDIISHVPEERLRLIVPSPAIARMLVDRYQLYVRKERGKEKYMLYRREKAMEGAPFRWSIEDVLEVDLPTLADETKLCEAVEYALRPETQPPF